MIEGESMGNVRHILGLSGGKDSAALAIYMRDKVEDMEYFFADTGKELPETYEYLDKLRARLGIEIKTLSADRGFDHWLDVYGGMLPSPKARWCTKALKIQPIEQFVGADAAISYIGIRADEENRKGYISTKENIQARFPFIEDGLRKDDVIKILEDSGIGLPKYYDWRSRSGCFFCFYQRKIEWVRLSEEHPDKFEEAVQYEEARGGAGYTWTQGETLRELIARKAEIIAEYESARERAQKRGQLHLIPNSSLADSLGQLLNEDDQGGCVVCHW
jgi:3'-phosphoadenosine 5'-phosphosulfate sulfotransferase (PAPS reductase)/FAD synthetase